MHKFYDPPSYCLASQFKDAFYSTYAGPFFIGSQHCLFLRIQILALGIQHSMGIAAITAILLIAAFVVPVFFTILVLPHRLHLCVMMVFIMRSSIPPSLTFLPLPGDRPQARPVASLLFGMPSAGFFLRRLPPT